MEGRRVVFFEVEDWEKRYFEDQLGGKAELTFNSHRLTLDNVDEAQHADVLATFIYSDLSAKVIDSLPNLKGIATMSVGCDHIDVAEATHRHIKVSNVPAYGPNTVAEHAVALLLALSRKIIPSVEKTRSEDYDYDPASLSGWDLFGKTIGIIGTGKIGAHVARIASGLGMKILAYDPKPNQELIEKFKAEYMSVDDILERADVITLHVPLCSDTENMLDKPQFARMKHGMVIINTARGGLINPDALLDALEDGTVSQAGLDVLPEEDLLREEKEFFSRYFKLKDYQLAMAGHALTHHKNVIVTPHNAFNSRESLKNIMQTTVDNIEGFLDGDPVNLVNK